MALIQEFKTKQEKETHPLILPLKGKDALNPYIIREIGQLAQLKCRVLVGEDKV